MQHYAGRVAENQCGNLVYATLAMRTVAHVCIECKQPVVLRKGKTVLKNGQMMVAHFAHKSTNVTKCGGYTGGETLEHLEAKWLLANNIQDFRFVMQSCDTCNAPNTEKCIKFNKDVWTVVVEGQIAGTGTGANARSRLRRADVLVQLNPQTKVVSMKPWYSLEVKHSHPVSAEKTKELHNVNCGIIEVLAEDVLEFKDIPASDKPCYLRNEHTLGCIPWTCAKCMQRVALQRAAIWIDYEKWYASKWVYQDALNVKIARDLQLSIERAPRDLRCSALAQAAIWVDYEKWYEAQWVYQDALNVKIARDLQRSLERAAWNLQISAELVVRGKKRKYLQAKAFQSMESPKRARFEKTLSKCVGKCVACHSWIYHDNYHTFRAGDDMAETERWWLDAIRNDDFLGGMHTVNKMVYCRNCVSGCMNCGTTQPIETLATYGLCRFCNMDDDWFDKHNKSQK
jgi:Competence protein CoiA-like family